MVTQKGNLELLMDFKKQAQFCFTNYILVAQIACA